MAQTGPVSLANILPFLSNGLSVFFIFTISVCIVCIRSFNSVFESKEYRCVDFGSVLFLMPDRSSFNRALRTVRAVCMVDNVNGSGHTV